MSPYLPQDRLPVADTSDQPGGKELLHSRLPACLACFAKSPYSLQTSHAHSSCAKLPHRHPPPEMSGAEAIAAIQAVDACIGIAKTIIDIGRAVSDAQGLPPKLRDLFEKSPVIEELLESAHDNFEEGKVAEDASKSAQPILKQCEQAF